jgi:hypothetical protein
MFDRKPTYPDSCTQSEDTLSSLWARLGGISMTPTELLAVLQRELAGPVAAGPTTTERAVRARADAVRPLRAHLHSDNLTN